MRLHTYPCAITAAQVRLAGFAAERNLIALLLPCAAAASFGADAPSDELYRLDGDLWPRGNPRILAGVYWLSLEELTKPEIPGATEQILQPRPDLLQSVVSIHGERFPHLTREEIMALINLPTDHLRHTRFAQEWMAEGEARGRQEGEAVITLRQLNRRCGSLSDATIARIQALPLEQLEALAEALLDYRFAGLRLQQPR